MQSYPSIPGPVAHGAPCIAFRKYDGTCIAAERSRRRRWEKFGTRNALFDRTHPFWGRSIDLFKSFFSEGLDDILRQKKYRESERVTAYFEYFGPSSFAGVHDWGELASGKEKLVLLDLWIDDDGIIPPRDFVKDFGRLPSAEVIYEGNFNLQFIHDVRGGKFPVEEGVVAKGINPRQGRGLDGRVWMAKIKTRKWLEELHRRAGRDCELKIILAENLREQVVL